MAMCKVRGDVVRNVRSLDVDQDLYRFNRAAVLLSLSYYPPAEPLGWATTGQ